ncbi:MAG: hypothetical protein HOQ17_06665 [Gemmatimonadaceae bacterium]|nr:hypothetical protein [Gemmatimonadaceae bacterium]NUS32729.1 hypothetical protein [Gemmatimonadaceae bacterium]
MPRSTSAAPRPAVRRTRIMLATLAMAGACATGVSPSTNPPPDPTTRTPRSTPAGATPLLDAAWPVRTREHVDLWLHAYALLTPDSTLVPYFRRGYAERVNALRRQRGITNQLDANRTTLLERINVNPALATNGQFLPLYFDSWEQMRQMIDLFVRAGGNPGMSNDPTTRTYLALLASVFPVGADREWLRQFAAAVDDESRRFYHDYWTSELRSHAAVSGRVDTLWQRQWRPALSRYLNNTQQQSGEVYLSLPLGGEGRTIHYGKQQNAVAVAFPDDRDQADVVLYVFAHEIVGATASAAIEDNTTPADRRAGTTSRYEQSAAVRAGALLLERTIPAVVPGYMRYYLQQAGRTPPSDPRAMFVQTFAVPDAVREAIARQLDVILGGI